MPRVVLVLMALAVAAPAHADPPKQPPVFPVVLGQKHTFSEKGGDPKEAWTTKLERAGTLVQYAPHEDTLNYFSKAGMDIRADGIYIQGETVADIGPPPGPAVKAIAFPIKTGGVGNVPGLFPTTYTVGAREKVKVPAGSYDAWHIKITDKVNPPGDVWIAPGVGVVKIRLPSGRVDELIAIAPAK
jgi:hypothetical protein